MGLELRERDRERERRKKEEEGIKTSALLLIEAEVENRLSSAN